MPLALLVVMKCFPPGEFLVSVAIKGDGCLLGFVLKDLLVAFVSCG